MRRLDWLSQLALADCFEVAGGVLKFTNRERAQLKDELPGTAAEFNANMSMPERDETPDGL